MQPVGVGIVGCGNISGIYLKNMTGLFPGLRVVGCADLDPARAQARAAEYPGVRAMTVDELLASPEIAIVVNLTIPRAHAELARCAVAAGKHVYNEKPLAVTRAEARALMDDAARAGCQVGCAPDTFLGAGLQTCRKLIADGRIGAPVAATAFMLCHGHESWHPDPAFYYKAGGGPMLDMGPYYITALLALMGSVRRVTGSARITFPERTITSKPKAGTTIHVDVPTHVAGILDFECGAIATLVTSFDVWGGEVPRIEIYGTEGTLSVPDPNTFGGPVRVRTGRAKEWVEEPLTFPYAENSRGLGVADLAAAVTLRRPSRASGALAFHALDIMEAIHDSSTAGRHITLTSGCAQPAPFRPGLRTGAVD